MFKKMVIILACSLYSMALPTSHFIYGGTSVINNSTINGVVIVDGKVISGSSSQIIKGSGNIVEKKIAVPGVERVYMQGFEECHITQDPHVQKEELVVKADENVLPFLKVEQNGKELMLKIKGENGLVLQNPSITYTMVLRKLSKVDLSGSAKMFIHELAGHTLDVRMSGSSRLDAILNVEKLRANMSGSSCAHFAGTARSQNIRVSENSYVEALKLSSSEGFVACFGASKFRLSAKEFIRYY